MKKNAIYGQSGGVTPVINSSASGTIRAAISNDKINLVYGALNGIDGIIKQNIVDLTSEDPREIEKISYSPGAVFGSCRRKLSEEDYDKIFKVFSANNIGYFYYNGGNDSMETAHSIAIKAKEIGYDLKVIGIPKTVDNDLMKTDHCPGFGSAAKFTATAMLEATKDLKSMHTTSTQVFILESMGRHAGWLAASGALAGINGEETPEIILMPEVPFDQDKFLQKVEYSLLDDGFCAIIASEALIGNDGKFISTSDFVDEFGNVQLGKVGIYLEKLIKNNLGKKVHVSLPDYLQRSSRHIASFSDWQEASEVGAAAVMYSTDMGLTDKMVAIIRDYDNPYLSHYEPVDLEGIAGETKTMPSEFIGEDNMSVTDEFIKYVRPLIKGEAPNLFLNGIPTYPDLKMKKITKKNI